MLECRAVQVLAGLRIQRRRIVDADLAVAGFGVDRVALDVELDLATPAGDAIRRLEAIALPCVWRLGHEVGLAIAACHQLEPQPETRTIVRRRRAVPAVVRRRLAIRHRDSDTQSLRPVLERRRLKCTGAGERSIFLTSPTRDRESSQARWALPPSAPHGTRRRRVGEQ